MPKTISKLIRRRFEGWLRLDLKRRDHAVNGAAAGKKAPVKSMGLDDRLREIIAEIHDPVAPEGPFIQMVAVRYFDNDEDTATKIEKARLAIMQAGTEGLWKSGIAINKQTGKEETVFASKEWWAKREERLASQAVEQAIDR